MTTIIKKLKQQLQQLQQEKEQLESENSELKSSLARAKNPEPVERPSFRRVLRLVRNACMELERTTGGWLLKMGEKSRFFKKLRQIWEIFIQENWYLSDIFSEPAPQTQPKKTAAKQPKRYPSIAPKPLWWQDIHWQLRQRREYELSQQSTT